MNCIAVLGDTEMTSRKFGFQKEINMFLIEKYPTL